MSEILFNQGGLGRLPAIDFRDRNYLLAPPSTATIGVTSREWRTGVVLNQGDTPQCVAYSGEQYLATGPVRNLFYKTPADLYHEAQTLDEWAPAPHDGTSVRALFKVLQAKGYVKNYQWAFDIDTVVRHVLSTGPVVFGTNWYVKMFDPDKYGFIWAQGPLAGGHAYLIKGVNTLKKCPDGTIGALRMVNSWGTNWGQKGYAWISFATASQLIKEYGEAATSLELKFVEA